MDDYFTARDSHLTNWQMCFYNQRLFSCGDWQWANFVQKCPFENRTGETCGLMLVYVAEQDSRSCRLCDAIARKTRRRTTELDRLKLWKDKGESLAASRKKARELVSDLDFELFLLKQERGYRKTYFSRKVPRNKIRSSIPGVRLTSGARLTHNATAIG